MASSYFEFLGSVWDQLPEQDRARMGELWQGYEQVFASVYQRFSESALNIAIGDMVPFATERWLPYTFDETNQVLRPATFTSNQDLSVGVNLTSRFLIKLSFDSGTPIELDLRGLNPAATSLDEIIQKINFAFGFTAARGVFQDSVLQLVSSTAGPTSKITIHPVSNPAQSAVEFIFGLLDTDLPVMLPEFPFAFSLPYPNIAGIPDLRDAIRDESVGLLLTSGVDYNLEASGVITFINAPPSTDLWAKRTLINEETPWNNFGFLMGIYEPNSVNYVTVLQGLWYAFWTGPKPSNVRNALYLLFGLPTAPSDGTILSSSPTQVQFQNKAGATIVFDVPTGLDPIVSAGDTVTKFQPLVSGIDIIDKISKPGFVAEDIGRAGIQRFLTEQASLGSGDTDETKALTLLEEHCFLPQINVNAFITTDINLGNVKTFLSAIKPLEKAFFFQIIVGTFNDELVVDDRIAMSVGMDVTPNTDSNQTTFDEESDLDDYEANDHPELNTDSDGILFQERLHIDVTSFGNPIDSFDA